MGIPDARRHMRRARQVRYVVIVVGAPRHAQPNPAATTRRALAADAVVAACDEAGGAIRTGSAVEAIQEVPGVTGRAMAYNDLEYLVSGGRMARARVRGVWWVYPTITALVVGERLLTERSGA